MQIDFSNKIEARSVKSALSWVGSFQFFLVAFRILVNLILAKLLLPEEFGLVAILTVLTEVIMGIINMGMGAAIIQKSTIDKLDFNSAFFGNFVMSLACAGIILILAQPISNFYEEAELVSLIRLLSFIFIIRGASTVQIAWYEKNMLFHTTVIISFIALVISNIVKILLALKGYGALSIVIGEIVFHALVTLTITLYSKFIPSLRNFSIKRFKLLFSFGNKLMLVDFLGVLSQRFDVLIIGKLASSRDLGIYTFSFMIAVSIINAINYVIQQVFFPKFSLIQNDLAELKQVYFRATKVIALLTLPICIGIFFVADEFINLLYKDKWEDAILIIKLLSIYAASNTLGGALWGQILKAKGLSKQVLYLTNIRFVVLFIMMLVVMIYSSIIYLSIGMIIYGFVFRFIFQFIVNKIMGFTMKEYLISIWSAIRNGLLLSSILIFVDFYLDKMDITLFSKLVLLVCSGIFSFVILLYFFEKNEINYVSKTLFVRKR